MTTAKSASIAAFIPVLLVGALQIIRAAPFVASDPGVRPGLAGAGDRVSGLTRSQKEFFEASREEFEGAESVEEGLGPRFNLDSCVGCHSQPVSGGSSPAVNPQVAAATAMGARNVVPSFITLNGPVREARFKTRSNGSPDGGVHSLFVVTGRSDAGRCNAVQENFEAQVAAKNISLRIPTPTFGAGLIEMIPDSAIEANRQAFAAEKAAFGVTGRTNRNGNDGTIARFGWKAQNKSLLIFAGEAYNVEMGISNDLFPDERDGNPLCQPASAPNSITDTEATSHAATISGIEQFGVFMRFLAPPTRSASVPGGSESIQAGRRVFGEVGCETCHTPSLRTGNSAITALANQSVDLFSDLLVHNMGPELADDISQGQAGGDEFRSAPLWGLGKRIFFLHDGRTSDLIDAIRAHRSAAGSKYPASEANESVAMFNRLEEREKQNLLNFLRSL